MAAQESGVSLEAMPAEVLCYISEYLDFESFIRFTRADPRIYRLFLVYRGSIILPILKREFSPVEGLFAVLASTARNTGNKQSPVLLEETLSGDRKHHLIGARRGEESKGHAHPHVANWKRLVHVCSVVKHWEAVFPRLRFAQRPQLARSLYEHEGRRLRKALYMWWQYAFHFHGDLPRPNQWIPDPLSTDVRLNLLRTLSTAELHELRDFWETVTFAVKTELCPSVDRVRSNAGTILSEAAADRLGWGYWMENQIVVETVLKLRPSDILEYLCNRHAYSKARLIHDIRLRHPSIERDRETLTGSLFTVLWERRWYVMAEKGRRAVKRKRYFPGSSFPKHHGGILDYKRPWEGLRLVYGDDCGKGIQDTTEELGHGRRLVPRGQLEARGF